MQVPVIGQILVVVSQGRRTRHVCQQNWSRFRKSGSVRQSTSRYFRGASRRLQVVQLRAQGLDARSRKDGAPRSLRAMRTGSHGSVDPIRRGAELFGLARVLKSASVRSRVLPNCRIQQMYGQLSHAGAIPAMPVGRTRF